MFIEGKYLNNFYFNSLDELDQWAFEISSSPLFQSLILAGNKLSDFERTDPPLDKALLIDPSQKYLPKLMVIHDFKGGYNVGDDFKRQVDFNTASNGSHYLLQFPQLVDTFVYFSHHLVTVPPQQWIQMCHKSGILCLGTLIFEGKSDASRMELRRLLSKESGRYKYIPILIKLLQSCGFDGWLLNVETTFPSPADAPELLTFIECLKSEMHFNNPEYQLVWYDSFVASNQLHYANGLSDSNYEYFKASDSMLTNYWWTEDILEESLTLGGVNGVSQNIFVGIDVWGRGSQVGSGGYDSAFAASKVKQYYGNIGLFAPAWTFEYFNGVSFEKSDSKLWIGENEQDYSIAKVVKAHHSSVYRINESDFIFHTHFSRGEGTFFNIEGVEHIQSPWVNGTLQDQIPLACYKDELKLTTYKLDRSVAFTGGQSLKVSKVVINPQSTANSLVVEQLVNHVSSDNIFSFYKDCLSPIIKCRVAYMYWKESQYGYFVLSLNFFVERRAKTHSRVRQETLKVFLYPKSNTDKEKAAEWRVIENIFLRPKLDRLEHFILESVSIHYEHTRQLSAKNPGLLESQLNEKHGTIALESDEESDDEEWVIVLKEEDQEPSFETLPTKTVHIGLLSISSIVSDEIADQVLDLPPVSKVTFSKFETEDATSVLISWPDIEHVRCWYVFLDGKLQGVTTSNSWIAVPKKKTIFSALRKVRIDLETQIGKVIQGREVPMKY